MYLWSDDQLGLFSIMIRKLNLRGLSKTKQTTKLKNLGLIRYSSVWGSDDIIGLHLLALSLYDWWYLRSQEAAPCSFKLTSSCTLASGRESSLPWWVEQKSWNWISLALLVWLLSDVYCWTVAKGMKSISLP